MRPRTDRLETGAAAERAARAFLEARGLQWLDAGWRCRFGELDLVMRDADTLVFVEVRARRADGLVGALESVDRHKRRRLVLAATAWLRSHPREAALPARFDVIGMPVTDGEPAWIRNAFDAHGNP